MRIVNLDASHLAGYCRQQIAHLLPTGEDPELGLIDLHLKEGLERANRCISAVRIWAEGELDILHSSQYCTFLYYLSNTIWRRERAKSVCTKLFLLNKALNAIDCFYELELPEIFFINHSVGIVLGKAVYGNRLVLFQNATVGKSHGIAPVLEDNVVIYPNCALAGRSLIRSGSVISQGVSVINQDTMANMVAHQGPGGKLVFKPIKRDILTDFFR